MGDVEIRAVGEDDLPAWLDAVVTGFLRLPDPARRDERLAYWRSRLDLARTRGAIDGGRWVGTYRGFASDVVLPGGTVLPAHAVTSVTVAQTHRRRGLLTRMIGADLADAAGRGDPLAMLVATEHAIYGRFGFGPATRHTTIRADVSRSRVTGLTHLMADSGGTVELVAAEDMPELGPLVHDAFRAVTPGAIRRDLGWWESYSGRVTGGTFPYRPRFELIHRDAGGRPTGHLAYRVSDHFKGRLPAAELTVDQLIAATPEAAAALWRHAMEVDYVRTVVAADRAVDDLLPLLLEDPRAAVTSDTADFLWVRVLDVPAVLAARGYAAPGRLVIEVADPLGHAAGRYVLDADPDGRATCAPTTADADLTLPVAVLGRLLLGDGGAVRLAAARLLDEHRPGAAARLDAMFTTPRAPWCPDWF